MSNAASTALKLLFAAIVVIGGLAYFALQSDPRNVAPPTPTSQPPHTLRGTNGIFQVPGVAWIEAFDPATNSNIPEINVWQAPYAESGGSRVSCQLADGDRVNMTGSDVVGGRNWVAVSSGDCSGWLLLDFLTDTSG